MPEQAEMMQEQLGTMAELAEMMVEQEEMMVAGEMKGETKDLSWGCRIRRGTPTT